MLSNKRGLNPRTVCLVHARELIVAWKRLPAGIGNWKKTDVNYNNFNTDSNAVLDYLLQLLLLIPGSLLVLVAHNEVLLSRSQRRTQAGGWVVQCLCLFGNVDQRRLEHLLHIHHCCGLKTAIPHLLHPHPDHWRRATSAYKHTLDTGPNVSYRGRWQVRLLKYLN